MGSSPAVLSSLATYDAIVVGARCAGSPTAMLLARKGYKVLLLDRATFPSDSMRAHWIRGAGVACLARWGLLDRVAACGCPPIGRVTTDLGDFPLAAPVAVPEGVAATYGPRRFALDAILVGAAEAAGAEVREGFAVREVLIEEGRVVGVRGAVRGGPSATKRARLVIGADGLHSLVARAVGAPVSRAKPALACAYYGYFAGLPSDGVEATFRPDRVLITLPTNDGLTLAFVAAPIAEFGRFRADPDGAFLASWDRVPRLAERMRAARRVERWRGTADLPNFFRRPFGPGWALVGDAGYHKDPIQAQGISDAFRDAELLAEAVDAGFSGRRPLAEALADYARRRDAAARPLYEEAVARAAFRPFPEEVYAERAALRIAA